MYTDAKQTLLENLELELIKYGKSLPLTKKVFWGASDASTLFQETEQFKSFLARLDIDRAKYLDALVNFEALEDWTSCEQFTIEYIPLQSPVDKLLRDWVNEQGRNALTCYANVHGNAFIKKGHQIAQMEHLCLQLNERDLRPVRDYDAIAELIEQSHYWQDYPDKEVILSGTENFVVNFEPFVSNDVRLPFVAMLRGTWEFGD